MIYLDNAATTRPNETALKYAEKYYAKDFYNPSSLYKSASDLSLEIGNAKKTILNTLSAVNFQQQCCHDLIFTSGGTESANAVIIPLVEGWRAKPDGVAVRHNAKILLTSETEHPCVYNCFTELKNRGANVTFAKCNKNGSVNVEGLLSLINNETAFVSVMHVNNETGAVNDINYIAKEVKKINNKIIFHSDGVQAFLKLDYKLSGDVDFYTISAHKIGGVKGVGAVIKKKGVNFNPLIFGGGQENNLRSGTENVFGIKNFEKAAEIYYSNLNKNFQRIKTLKECFLDNLSAEHIKVSDESCLPHILSVSFKGLRGEVLLHMLEKRGILISTGSACSSKSKRNRVIEACGYDKATAEGNVRVSFCADNTLEEVKYAAEVLSQSAMQLKKVTSNR